MVKEQKMRPETSNQSAEKSGWKKLLAVIGLVIGVPLVAYLALDLNYLHHINNLKDRVNLVWQESIQPLGGIKHTEGPRCPQLVDAIFQADAGPCPEYGASWLVLMDSGKEDSFIELALQKSDTASLTKKGLDISMTFYSASGTSLPYRAPAGKEWKILNVSVYDHLANFQTIFFPGIIR